MKTTILSILCAMMVLPALGQEDDSTFPRRYNEGKFVVTDLVRGTYALGYERTLGKHIGVALNAGFKSTEGLLKLSGLDTEFIKTDDLTYTGTRFIPEFRYYLNESENGRLTGFYFGSYLIFANYKSNFAGLYSNENGDFPFDYGVKVNTASFGLMVGYKLKLSQRFSLDFLIAGPGAGSYKVKLEEIVAAPSEFFVDLNDALELISLADLLDADFEFSDSNRDDSLVLPSFRYGITLGYSF